MKSAAVLSYWHWLLDVPQQPVGSGVQDEAQSLGGVRRPARCAVTGNLGLVQLDQVLGLPARAVEHVLHLLGLILGLTFGQRRDDVANIDAQRASLDARRDTALAALAIRRSGCRYSCAAPPCLPQRGRLWRRAPDMLTQTCAKAPRQLMPTSIAAIALSPNPV